MYAGIFMTGAIGSIYLGRNWDTPEEELAHPNAPSGWGLGLFWTRAKTRLADMLDYYNEPAFPKLLPDVDPAWERPYTLVLSLEDLLVHSEWSREHGWRMAKRPGMDYFIRYLSQYYEIVLFTSVPSMIADPVIRKLDPYRIIMWPLFREATRYKNGEYIKVCAPYKSAVPPRCMT
jgi:import inner membrane translocase subunit TIM50